MGRHTIIERLNWATYKRDISATDDNTRFYCWWTPLGGWDQGTLPPASLSYPRRRVLVFSVFAFLADTNVVMKDGCNVIMGELGPQPNSMIEHKAYVQSAEVRAYEEWPTGMPVDSGVCVQLPLGSHAVTDVLYVTVKYADLGEMRQL